MLLQVGLGIGLKAVVEPMLCRQLGLGLLFRHAIQPLELEKPRGLLYREEEQQDGGEGKQYDLDVGFHLDVNNLQK